MVTLEARRRAQRATTGLGSRPYLSQISLPTKSRIFEGGYDAGFTALE